jgi:hypothetical protein
LTVSAEEVEVARGWVHTVCRDGVWVVEVEGALGGDEGGGEGDGERVISRHGSKEGAAAVGRVRAIERETVHVIHNADGTVAGRSDFRGYSGSDVG